MRCCAMGRAAVRGILRSVERSSAWFSALEPAVTSAMPKSALTSSRLKGEIPEASEPR